MRITPISDDEIATVDARLPLARLDGCREGRCFYLVAWDDDEPVGHAHLRLGEPAELGDVWVLPEHRRRGVATALTAAAEREAAVRGCTVIELSYGIANEGARRVYERAGYVDAGRPPKRVRGTLVLRGEEVEVDDTLVYLCKRLSTSSTA